MLNRYAPATNSKTLRGHSWRTEPVFHTYPRPCHCSHCSYLDRNKLIALAAQRFISEIASDAQSFMKVRMQDASQKRKVLRRFAIQLLAYSPLPSITTWSPLDRKSVV